MNTWMLAKRFACVTLTPLGREVEPLVNWRKAMSSRPIFSGRRFSSDSRMPSTATTCSRAGDEACTVAEQALDPGGRDECARAALGDDVAGVVEVALELPEAERRVDGDRDDAGAHGAEEAQDEVLGLRKDERDPVALAEAEGLEGAAVAGAGALDGGIREGRLARPHARRRRHAGFRDEAEAARGGRLGGVLDGLGDGSGRRHPHGHD